MYNHYNSIITNLTFDTFFINGEYFFETTTNQ
jgi:hypothetical protein